jgi:DnaK suppressor protein
MKKTIVNEYKKRLTAERTALAEKIGSQEHNLAVDGNEMPDPVDLAAQAFSKNVILALSENETRQLGMIDEALRRIEDGEYGECINCGNEINTKRLDAVPWARYDIACQELVEQGMLEENEV